MTRTRIALPNMGPMLARWDREHAALAREPYTVRVRPREHPTIARLGNRAYYAIGADPTAFRVVTPADAAAIDAAHAELARLHASLDDLARKAYRRGRPVARAEAAAAQARVYGD